jgi:serine/threonine-protein kinase|tara:strand:- start:213 stop:623 length:411 start_codon:yes stop_codon:yes gene_type:complete
VTAANERSPAWSVDGAWLAYVSNENGFDQVYVQPYPPDGNRMIVSPSGGTEPVWSRDGRELFYRRNDEMIAAEFTEVDGVLVIGASNRLFEHPFEVDPGGNLPNYDVTPDGSFLMLQRAESRHEIQIVVGWKPGLR